MEQAAAMRCGSAACAEQDASLSHTYSAVDLCRDTRVAQGTVATPAAIKPTQSVSNSGPPISQAAAYVNTCDHGNGRTVRVYTHTGISISNAFQDRALPDSRKYP